FAMRRRYIAVPAASAAIAAAIAWWSPWSTPPDVIAGARQAFGTQREVHVLASLGIDPNGPAMRPITSGESIEVWYDPSRTRTHVVRRRGTKVTLDEVDDQFESPYVPSPALWEFVSGYRRDLAHGRFRTRSEMRVEGRRVLWLHSRTPSPGF